MEICPEKLLIERAFRCAEGNQRNLGTSVPQFPEFSSFLPDALARPRKVLVFYSHPWVSLLVGIFFVALLAWGALRLIRG